jgi:hypothetical protein
MTTSTKRYLEELRTRLRARGVASEHVDEVVREAESHLAEAGGDPATALGPVDEFVEAFATRGGETATWDGPWEYRTLDGATAFNELALLAEAGRDRWELIGCGPLQLHFRRRAGAPPRWEYRRRVGGPGLDAELAREGWELATTWMLFRYYRRRSTG